MQYPDKHLPHSTPCSGVPFGDGKRLETRLRPSPLWTAQEVTSQCSRLHCDPCHHCKKDVSIKTKCWFKAHYLLVQRNTDEHLNICLLQLTLHWKTPLKHSTHVYSRKISSLLKGNLYLHAVSHNGFVLVQPRLSESHESQHSLQGGGRVLIGGPV